jgi:ferredoxin-NADP reductase
MVKMKQFEASLIDIIPRGNCDQCFETCSYRFDNPLNIQYKAGQYFFVTIKKEEGEYRHHFSFSSSPTESDYLEFSTKLRDTEFKNVLRELKIGDKVLIKAPAGEFTLDDSLDKIGMITGGIGITPLRSICKYCTDEQISKNIILLYGNHSEKDIAFKDDFDKMQNLNQNLRVAHTISKPSGSWKGHAGRINQDMLKKEIPDFVERQFYLSGPQGMVQAIDKLLLELEVPKKQIKKEVFPRY